MMSEHVWGQAARTLGVVRGCNKADPAPIFVDQDRIGDASLAAPHIPKIARKRIRLRQGNIELNGPSDGAT